jgi:hypothetical protein
MPMEANLLGSGLTFNFGVLDLSLGEFAAQVLSYMKWRDESRREGRETSIDDLRAAAKIVMWLTTRYIDLMQDFSAKEIVERPQSLKETIKEADDYLKARDLLPHLDIITGEVEGLAGFFTPEGLAFRAAHKSLVQFRQSLGSGLGTGVGLVALEDRIQNARKLLKEPPSVEQLEQFTLQTEIMLEQTDLSASDKVYASIGRAIRKLKH